MKRLTPAQLAADAGTGSGYAGAARHICRACGKVFDPDPLAHRRWGTHMRTKHGHRFVARLCLTECGGRARPSEGRYTPAEVAEGAAVTDAELRGED